jgi:adenosylmethionine-8-amino-7-oxononanoate aminotransferase
VANLEIWDREPVRERIAAIAEHHRGRLEALAEDPRFAHARQCGTIAAIDAVVPNGGYLAGVGPKLGAYFAERGLLIRPLGNTLYLLPPYCVSERDLDELYDGMLQAVSHC